MATRRELLIGAGLLMLAPTSGAAAEQSAQQFLESIYAHYKGKDTKGVSLGERGAQARATSRRRWCA